jgi:hypothetical protein
MARFLFFNVDSHNDSFHGVKIFSQSIHEYTPNRSFVVLPLLKTHPYPTLRDVEVHRGQLSFINYGEVLLLVHYHLVPPQYGGLFYISSTLQHILRMVVPKQKRSPHHFPVA